MLSIGKLGAGQEIYYTEKVAEGAEDYYSGEGEAEGYWLGEAAAELGLCGEVSAEELTAMLRGRNPLTGEPLGLRSPPGREPVPGFDLTFSAPKSVSVAWALGGHPVGAEIKAAHAASVHAALGYLEHNACWTRRGHGGHEFLPGNGFLAAAYLHRSSRAGDPQLHTHVLIANATRGPDGRWSRLYHPAIYEHAKSAGYIYEAHLRDELTRRLGVEWGAVKNGIAEIEGFTPEQLGAFSTRRKEILEAVAVDASMSAKRIATLETRRAKERDISEESLRERWISKAAEVGLDREAVRATLGQVRRIEIPRVSIGQVEDALTAHASTFERRDVIQAVASNLRAGAPAQMVEAYAEGYLSLDAVVPLGASAKGERYTTRWIWELEQKALASAEAMAARRDRAVAGEILAARAIDARPTMKPDQRAMVERLLCRGEGLVVVVGEAGTGKSYALAAAASGWAGAPGIALRAAAPTWRAANVLRAEGLPAMSVARLLRQCDGAAEEGGESPLAGSVLVVDEAGMVSSQDLARLIEHARAAEAKLVVIGDPAQLGEIEAGGLFAALVERTEPVRLDEVIRHHYEIDREAAKLIREGEGTEAIEVYRSSERVVVCEDSEQRRVEMANDWWASYRTGEDSLMIARTNAEVERLNALGRELMRAEGRLGSSEIEVGEQRFAAGDQVITRVNDQRAEVFNRERWRIAEVDAEQRRVVLEGIDASKRVQLDSSYLAKTNASDGSPALALGYAATIYQAQGATLDRAYVMADAAMDRQAYYVAASRTRQETYFYATPQINTARQEFAPSNPNRRHPLAHIAEAAERDGAQVAAHDAALRGSLGQLPTRELKKRRGSLERGFEEAAQALEHREHLEREIAHRQELLLKFSRQIAELPEPGLLSLPSARREHERRLSELDHAEMVSEQIIRGHRWELHEMREVLEAGAPPRRAEAAVIDYLLAERARLRQAAWQIEDRIEMGELEMAPPGYLTKEIGRRPSDPEKAREWDKAARSIQRYRREHEITDPHSALGPEPRERLARIDHEHLQRSLIRSREALGLSVQVPSRARNLDRGMGIEL